MQTLIYSNCQERKTSLSKTAYTHDPFEGYGVPSYNTKLLCVT